MMKRHACAKTEGTWKCGNLVREGERFCYAHGGRNRQEESRERATRNLELAFEGLRYHGRPMTFAPINVSVLHLIQTLHRGEPQVVILEPGDATRYMLLLLPLNHQQVGSHLSGLGIPSDESDRYLFVSKLSCDECPGTWLPFGPDVTVGTYHVTELTTNEWSRELLGWWFTHLYRLLLI